ncbi:MAG TPA: DUF4920 domain-containing protein [Mucilaginibacter sp.]|nr:DUF4920 domain-containing protein [Mucilaginibacter sp.]
MKACCLLLSMLFSLQIFSQKHTALPHGMVYGIKPDTTVIMSADKLEAFMDKKTRISTTIRGKVIRVTRQQGGWFELDAGNGKVISAHFRVYNVSIPADLKGKTIIVEGVGQKQFIADDQQHFAGDTVTGKKQQNIKTDPKRRLTFEVKGLMVDH